MTQRYHPTYGFGPHEAPRTKRPTKVTHESQGSDAALGIWVVMMLGFILAMIVGVAT